jgi:hypothetical protein
MTDPERDYLLQRIGELERRLRRWRVACLVLLGLLVLPVVLGGLLGVAWLPRLEAERARVLDMGRMEAREAEMRAREEAERARAEAARAEEFRRQAEGQDRPGKD